MGNRTDERDARHIAALDRIQARMDALDPWDESEATRAQRRRLAELSHWYSERIAMKLGGRIEGLCQSTREALGLPREGAVDWAMARERWAEWAEVHGSADLWDGEDAR